MPRRDWCCVAKPFCPPSWVGRVLHVVAGGGGGTPPVDPGFFRQLTDTFTSGSITGLADNGPMRTVLAGHLLISGGLLEMDNVAGVYTNPSILTWHNLDIADDFATPTQIDFQIPLFSDNYGFRLYFACQDDTRQNGYALDVPNGDYPTLVKIAGGVETIIRTGTLSITNSGILYGVVKLEGGIFYCEIQNDATFPDNSFIYETPISNAQSYKKIAVALYGNAGVGQTQLDSIETAYNDYLLLDTFYSPSNANATLTNFTADDGTARTSLSGKVIYDDADGIGAKWANDGRNTNPAVFSYGDVESSMTLTACVKNLDESSPIIYFCCDATLQNGWFVQVNPSTVRISRIDGGVESAIQDATYLPSAGDAVAARVTFTTIGGSIALNVIALDSNGQATGDIATASVNMAGQYDTQRYIGIGLPKPNGSQDDSIYYLRVA